MLPHPQRHRQIKNLATKLRIDNIDQIPRGIDAYSTFGVMISRATTSAIWPYSGRQK